MKKSTDVQAGGQTVAPKVGMMFLASGKAKNKYEVVNVRGKTTVIRRVVDGITLEVQNSKFSAMVAEVVT